MQQHCGRQDTMTSWYVLHKITHRGVGESSLLYCTISRSFTTKVIILLVFMEFWRSRRRRVSKFPSLLGSSKLKGLVSEGRYNRIQALRHSHTSPFTDSDLAQAVMRFFEHFGLILSKCQQAECRLGYCSFYSIQMFSSSILVHAENPGEKFELVPLSCKKSRK